MYKQRAELKKLVLDKRAGDWPAEVGIGNKALQLPLDPRSGGEILGMLLAAQLDDKWSYPVIMQLRSQLDPGQAAQPGSLDRRQASYLDRLRLSPFNEGLEYEHRGKETSFWVPYFPNTYVPWEEDTWRHWVFEQVHLTLASGLHRPLAATIIMMTHMAWWPSIKSDGESWWYLCEICAKNRSKALKGLLSPVDEHAAERDLCHGNG